MYTRPVLQEIDLATATSCCSPTQDPYTQCRAQGGVWLKAPGGLLPSCLTPASAGQAVDGWLDYAFCLGEGYCDVGWK